MEAWILHIRTEQVSEGSFVSVNNEYSAWMNENQAIKAAGKYLSKVSDESAITTPFYGQWVLRQTIRTLVQTGNVSEAIDLVNEFSVSHPKRSGQPSSAKVIITIRKSTFLGSPFE